MAACKCEETHVMARVQTDTRDVTLRLCMCVYVCVCVCVCVCDVHVHVLWQCVSVKNHHTSYGTDEDVSIHVMWNEAVCV